MDILTGAVSKFPQVILFFQERKSLLRYYLLLVDPYYPFPQFFHLHCIAACPV
jgi:hypothetical protein